MTYRISQTDPAQLSTEEIHEEIAGFSVLAAEVVARWAALLRELSVRRAPHPMFNHPVMQFWRSIVEYKLSPRAAVLLADRNKGAMIRAVLPLPIGEQERIAEGKELPVAMLTDTGDIIRDDKPITRMDQQTIRRVFGPSGIRSFDEQREILKEEAKVHRIGTVTVLHEEGALKIGNQKLTPDELRKALWALGYDLTLRQGYAPIAAE